jgi:non-homologous end joining protein Ku
MAQRVFRASLVVKIGGLDPVFVDLYSVKEAEAKSNFSTVCIGTTDTPHDPSLVNRVYRCPECSTDTGFVKGREVDGQIVVISADALKGTEADDDVKQQMVCTAHPLVDVLLSTIPGSMVYYVTPAKAKNVKGFNQQELDEGYALLDLLVRANPDKAICTVYAPTSKPSMFRFAPFGAAITLSQLEWPESLRPLPVELPTVELDDVYVQLAPNMQMQEFDPALYKDDQKAARDELVEAVLRGDLPAAVPAVAPAVEKKSSMLDKFKAQMGAPAPEVKKPARKKPAPKTAA